MVVQSSAEERVEGGRKVIRFADTIPMSTYLVAYIVGELEASGLSFRDADRIPEHLKAVTAEQVRSVAAKYLIDDTLTVAILDPQPVSRSASPHGAPAATQ